MKKGTSVVDQKPRSTRRLRLIRGGLLKPGRGTLPVLLKKAPSGSDSGVLAALLAERGDPH